MEKTSILTAINKDWRVEKILEINKHGGWIFFSKSVSVTSRLLERREYIDDVMCADIFLISAVIHYSFPFPRALRQKTSFLASFSERFILSVHPFRFRSEVAFLS